MLNFYLYLIVAVSAALVTIARVKRMPIAKMQWLYPALLAGVFVVVKYCAYRQFTSLSASYVCSMLLFGAFLVGRPPRLLGSAWFWRVYFASFVALIVAYLFFAAGSDFDRKRVLYDPNTEMMGLMVLSFPLIIARSRKRLRIPIYLLGLLGLLAWLTLSRTGFAVTIFLFGCTLRPVGWLLRSRVVVVLMAIAFVALSFLLPLYKSSGERADVSQRLVSVADGSFEERQLLVLEGLSLWTQDTATLLFGVPTSHLMKLGATNSMHNGYLELLVSTGLVGFTAFGAFLFLFARKYLTPGTTPIFLAYLLAAGVSVLLLNSMIFFFFVSALIGQPYAGRLHVFPRALKNRRPYHAPSSASPAKGV